MYVALLVFFFYAGVTLGFALSGLASRTTEPLIDIERDNTSPPQHHVLSFDEETRALLKEHFDLPRTMKPKPEEKPAPASRPRSDQREGKLDPSCFDEYYSDLLVLDTSLLQPGEFFEVTSHRMMFSIAVSSFVLGVCATVIFRHFYDGIRYRRMETGRCLSKSAAEPAADCQRSAEVARKNKKTKKQLKVRHTCTPDEHDYPYT